MKKKKGRTNTVPDPGLNEKVNSLREILREMVRILLAFSGGVESIFLLKIAHEELGEDALAVAAVCPIHSTEEYESACQIVRSFKIKHMVIETHELNNPTFWSNSPDQYYFCKKELFQTLQIIARQENIPFVIDAGSIDDLSDFRLGRTAGHEESIRSPLIEAKLTKKRDSDPLPKTKNGTTPLGKPLQGVLGIKVPIWRVH